MATTDALIPNVDIWKTSGMIIPAIMTLICFICTAVSLTVSGFICLRDREAQDEIDNKAKHHKQQEFISKALGLFYKIRTSNVFRIQEIMQDLNDERPVWIGSKTEIIANLEYYGIFMSEQEKAKLMNSVEVFEIDCESLFYFELERFSKAQAVYGGNVLKYFECIQQDGSSFPREFYPDAKAVFHIDIIYNVFTEMQILTELFVLLSTGLDLEIINIYSLPAQFKHSKLGDELSKIRDFLYNYYIRVFPTERSSANVMRKLPQLPIVYEPIFEMLEEPIAKTEERGGRRYYRSRSKKQDDYDSPTERGGGFFSRSKKKDHDESPDRGGGFFGGRSKKQDYDESPDRGGGFFGGRSKKQDYDSPPDRDYRDERDDYHGRDSGSGSGGSQMGSPTHSLSPRDGEPPRRPKDSFEMEIPESSYMNQLSVTPGGGEFYDTQSMASFMGSMGDPQAAAPWTSKPSYFQSKGRRITATLSKRRMKIVSVYKTLAQRLRQRSHVQGDEQMVEETASILNGNLGGGPTGTTGTYGGPGGTGTYGGPGGAGTYGGPGPGGTYQPDNAVPGSSRKKSMYHPDIAGPSGQSIPGDRMAAGSRKPAIGGDRDVSPPAETTRTKQPERPAPPIGGRKRGKSPPPTKEKIREKERERGRERSRKRVEPQKPQHSMISEKMKREKLLDAMRRRYKAPPRPDSSQRRRGRLAKVVKLDHNAFTYMVTRVLAFLQEKGFITEEELNSERYRCIDKSFIV